MIDNTSKSEFESVFATTWNSAPDPSVRSMNREETSSGRYPEPAFETSILVTVPTELTTTLTVASIPLPPVTETLFALKKPTPPLAAKMLKSKLVQRLRSKALHQLSQRQSVSHVLHAQKKLPARALVVS